MSVAIQVGPTCPGCRADLDRRANGYECVGCGGDFPDVAGMPDLRLASDRYLALPAERAKAEKLARIARASDLEGVARAYYDMTPDVDPKRCELFLRHILRAEERGEMPARRVEGTGPTLELGCGTGGLTLALSRRGVDVTAVDIAARWLVAARRRLADDGREVPLIAADAEALPWPDACFATVVADSLLEHCDHPRMALREAFRVLRPGGRLILWSPNRYAPIVDPHVRLWGVGYMPRRWAEAYVQKRRGAWLPRTLSAREARRLAFGVGFRCVKAEAPSIENADATGVAARIYRALQTRAPGRFLLRWIGPVWELTAVKPV